MDDNGWGRGKFLHFSGCGARSVEEANLKCCGSQVDKHHRDHEGKLRTLQPVTAVQRFWAYFYLPAGGIIHIECRSTIARPPSLSNQSIMLTHSYATPRQISIAADLGVPSRAINTSGLPRLDA